MAKQIPWRKGVLREVTLRQGVKGYEYRCERCSRLVFDVEKKRPIGTYEKQDVFKTGTMLCCGRCGQSVGVIVES